MTHLHIASLLSNSHSYVTQLLAGGDYGAICANPLFALLYIKCFATRLARRHAACLDIVEA